MKNKDTIPKEIEKEIGVPIICKGCGKECEWDDDGLCEECRKKTYDELEME